jgi:hypothetical protein
MRALAAELRPHIHTAKRMFRGGLEDQALRHLQEIADGVKQTLSSQLRKCGIFRDSKGAVHVDEKPEDIVIWLVAKKFHVSLPRTKTVIAARSVR